MTRSTAYDSYVHDYERLDAISRTRALTDVESLRLEECIKRLSDRNRWKMHKRKAKA